MRRVMGRSGAEKRWRVATTSAVVLVALLSGAAAADSSSITFEETATFEKCHDQVNFLRVPKKVAEDRVPDDYKDRLSTDAAGQAEFVISELRCERVTIGGNQLSAPVSMAFANFTLASAPNRSDDDPLTGDVYLLFFSTDIKPLADWLRAETNLEAYYVPDIVHDYTIPESFGEADYFFKSPGPMKWAFTAEGTASVQNEVPIRIPKAWAWQDTKTSDGKTWRVALASSEHDNYAFFPVDVTIHTVDGSEIREILGTNTAKDEFAVSGLIPRWEVEKTRTVI